MLLAGSGIILDQRIKNMMISVARNLHQCSQCQASYTRTSELRMHIEAQHFSPGYECEYCTQPFKVYKKLRAHKLKCHFGLKCAHCNKEFKNRKAYNSHLIGCTLSVNYGAVEGCSGDE